MPCHAYQLAKISASLLAECDPVFAPCLHEQLYKLEIVPRDPAVREIAEIVDCFWWRLKNCPFDCSERVVVHFVVVARLGLVCVCEVHEERQGECSAGTFVP